MKQFKTYKWRFVAVALLFSVFVACNDDDDATMNPTADFSAEMNDLEVSFTYSGEYAVTLNWDFGDGETSTIVNPTHSYSAEGDYTVTLKAFGVVGADTAVVTKTITVAQINPTANFTYTVDGTTLTLANTSERAVSYAWDFGDGETSTDENPTHTYAEAGEYTVTLTATGVEGSVPSTVTKNVAAGVKVFEPVALENGDMELPGTGRLKNWEDIPGWSSDAPTVDSGVEAGAWWMPEEDKDYAGVLFNVDGSAYNLSEHVIAAGEDLKVNLNVINIWNSSQITVSLYYDSGDGTRNVLASQSFDVIDLEYTAVELTAIASAESVGAKLGVEVLGISADGTDSWAGFDDVQLFVK